MASPIVTASSQAFAARAVVEPDWLAADRAAALARFVELGVPGRREEAWRFTDTRPLTEAHARVVPDADHGIDPERLAAHRLSGQSHFIAVVNGRVRPDLSAIGELPRGVWLGSVSDTIDLRPDLLRLDTTDSLGKQPFASLNAALFTDGFVLAIEPGIVLTRPVEILYLGDGTGASHVSQHDRDGRGVRGVNCRDLCRERPALDQCRERDRCWRGCDLTACRGAGTGYGGDPFLGRARATGGIGAL